MTSIGILVGSVHDDTETELAAGALTWLFRERQLNRYRTWLETRATYPKRWREAAGDSEYVFHLTVEELTALDEELSELLLPRFRERLTDPAKRPAGSIPVELLLFAYPIARPPAER